MKEIFPKEDNLAHRKPKRQLFEWIILIICIFTGGLLNSGRFSNSPKIETFVQVVFLVSIGLWIVLIWKKSIRYGATFSEKIIQFLRILLAIILFLSLGALIRGNSGNYNGVILGLIISSVLSALGLLLLTVYVNIIGKGNTEKK